VLDTLEKARVVLKQSHFGKPELSHGILKDLTWSSQGGTALGLLFIERGLTWQFPCCFLGRFLPDLGAGTQLTVAISQPSLVTAARAHTGPISTLASRQPRPQKDAQDGRVLLGRGWEAGKAHPSRDDPCRCSLQGMFAEQRAGHWMLPGSQPSSVPLPVVGTTRYKVCSLPEMSEFFHCYFCKRRPDGVWHDHQSNFALSQLMLFLRK